MSMPAAPMYTVPCTRMDLMMLGSVAASSVSPGSPGRLMPRYFSASVLSSATSGVAVARPRYEMTVVNSGTPTLRGCNVTGATCESEPISAPLYNRRPRNPETGTAKSERLMIGNLILIRMPPPSSLNLEIDAEPMSNRRVWVTKYQRRRPAPIAIMTCFLFIRCANIRQMDASKKRRVSQRKPARENERKGEKRAKKNPRAAFASRGYNPKKPNENNLTALRSCGSDLFADTKICYSKEIQNISLELFIQSPEISTKRKARKSAHDATDCPSITVNVHPCF